MEHITINSDRSVTVPIELRKIGVQYDHNVNTIEFVGPRYSGNVDLSTMTIYINYILSDKTPGKYKAENVIIDEQDNSLIRFNWTITRNVTKVSGILSCLVCAKKTDEEGNEINHWNTDIFRLLSVSEGMENDLVIQEQYPDIITSLIQNVNEHDGKLLEFSGLDTRVTDIENNVNELKGEIDNIHIPEQIQADWTQNDESAPDYIKNKPFYDNSWVLDTSNVLETNDINSSVGFVLVSNNPDDFYLLDNLNYYGKYYYNPEYKLTISYYTTYDCSAFYYTNDNGNETTICYVVRQENTLISIYSSGTRYEISNPSIGIWVKHDPQSNKIASIYTKDVHKIDEKYLPDLAKHPDWNQDDETAVDFVKNRPILPISEIANYGVGFGISTALKAVTINLTKDSNADGLTFINNTQYPRIYLGFNKKQIGNFQWYYDGEISFTNNTSKKVINGQCNKDRFNITYDADGNIVNSNVDFKCFRNQVLLASVDQQEDEYKTPSRDTDPATKKYVDDSVADCIKSPASAEVGQIVKIAAVDDAGKPTVWEAVDPPEQVQPDWNEQDTNSDSYIKNKPSIPKVTNDLTDELKSNYDEAVTNSHVHNNKSVIDSITAEKVSNWDNKSEFDGQYSSLKGIPDDIATEKYVNEKLETKANENDLSTVAKTGSYNDLKDIPDSMPASDVYQWAKQTEKPDYTAEEVGALPAVTNIPSKTSELQNDSGFLTEHQDLSNYARKNEIPKTASDVGADASGTAESKVSAHNTATDAHNDIRLLVQGLTARLNALADSDDTTLDQMSEVVAYIKSNKSLIDSITTSKINVSDIIDNLTTNVSNKPLSAAQGVALKALIDAIPTVELDETLTDNTKAAPAGMVGELKGDLTNYDRRISSLENSGVGGGIPSAFISALQEILIGGVFDDSKISNPSSKIYALSSYAGGSDTPITPPSADAIYVAYSGTTATINNLKNLTVSYAGTVATVGV